MTGVWDETDTKGSNVCACLAVHGQDVAPADNQAIAEGDELAEAVLDDIAIEGESLFGGRCLSEGQELPLARHIVEGLVKALKVCLLGWDDSDVHGAQRSSSGAAEARRAEGIEKRSFSTVPWNEGLGRDWWQRQRGAN